jgi:predicted DNA-binding transcriptional regulator YafY
MKKTDALTQLRRLDTLADQLSDGNVHKLLNLSLALEVSARTIARDIKLLRNKGWAIEGAAGVGGGVCLKNQWPVDTAVLRESEAVEVLLALAVSEAMGLSTDLQLASIRARLARTFAPADKARIDQLRRRIRVATPLAAETRVTQQHKKQSENRPLIHHAFLLMQTLAFSYVDADQKISQRLAEPQYLIYAWPLWYVLAWDLERKAIRTFRVDRMNQISLPGQGFRMKAPEPFWRACEDVGIRL